MDPIVFIPLTQGYVAVIDFADFEKVRGHKWHVAKKSRGAYATRNLPRKNGRQTRQYLHQFLMPDVEQIDHKDGNGLNNRRKNLRAATERQNHRGFQRKTVGATSKYRGVCQHSQVAKWQAQIGVNGKLIYLGLFSDPESAARAYDFAARKHFGEFASPNFPA